MYRTFRSLASSDVRPSTSPHAASFPTTFSLTILSYCRIRSLSLSTSTQRYARPSATAQTSGQQHVNIVDAGRRAREAGSRPVPHTYLEDTVSPGIRISTMDVSGCRHVPSTIPIEAYDKRLPVQTKVADT